MGGRGICGDMVGRSVPFIFHSSINHVVMELFTCHFAGNKLGTDVRRSGTAVQGRNLSAYDRSVLALKLKPIIAERAKENERKGGGSGISGRQKSDNPTTTTKELAKAAGVSHDTIHKVEKIETDQERNHPPRSRLSGTASATASCRKVGTLLPGTECGRKCKVYNILYFTP